MNDIQEGINKRFRETIAKIKFDDTRLTNIKLAAELGISPTYLGSILKGTNGKNASVELVKRLSDAYPTADYAYIIGSKSEQKQSDSEVVRVTDFGPTVKVPYIRVSAFASFLAHSDINNYPELEYMELPTSMLPHGVKGQFVFDVRGESMYPTIKAGTQVLCTQIAHADIKYISSGIYVVAYGDEFVIKRVKDNNLLVNGTLTLHSDNTNIAGANVITEDRIRAVWRVTRKLNEAVE